MARKSTKKEYADKVEALFKQGKTSRQIAKELNSTKAKCDYVIHKLCGLTRQKTYPPPVKICDEVKNRVLHLYTWGYTLQEINEEVHAPINQIQELILKSNVKRRIRTDNH